MMMTQPLLERILEVEPVSRPMTEEEMLRLALLRADAQAMVKAND